jgi:hypothetical protein
LAATVNSKQGLQKATRNDGVPVGGVHARFCGKARKTNLNAKQTSKKSARQTTKKRVFKINMIHIKLWSFLKIFLPFLISKPGALIFFIVSLAVASIENEKKPTFCANSS